MAPHTRVHNWAAITLGEADSFAAALDLMNRGGYQLALVRRADGRLAGAADSRREGKAEFLP